MSSFFVNLHFRKKVGRLEIAIVIYLKMSEIQYITRRWYLFVLVGWVFFFCGICGQLEAQMLRGKVYSIDEKGDTMLVSMARLQWLHTAVGTYSNTRGAYEIPFGGTDTLVVSYYLYKPDTLIIRTGEKKRNIYINLTQSLQEVVVSKKKKPKYVRKGNPAVELVENVIKHKNENRIEHEECYKSQVYKKMVMSLGKMNNVFQKKNAKKVEFLKMYIDTLPPDSELILPFSIREALSDYYYQKSPVRKVSYLKARRMQGPGEVLDEEGLGTNLDALFSEVNIFDNDIEIMLLKFVSPLSSTLATTYYHYFITDTLMVDSVSCIELSFAPVNSRMFGFTGRMYIVNDSSYALKQYTINVPVDINLNYVKKLIISRSFKRMDNGLWASHTGETFSSLTLVKQSKMRQIYVRQNTYWYDYEPGVVLPDSLSTVNGEKEALDAENHTNKQWVQMRPIRLSNKESYLDSLSYKLRKLPVFRGLEAFTELVVIGFIPTNRDRRESRFDIGTVYSMISYNPTEGLRLKIGGMTTAKLHDQFFTTGYLAFGCKDLKFKYGVTLLYSLLKKERHCNESPKHAVSFTSSYDMEMIGQNYSYMDRDNILMSSFAKASDLSAQYVRRFKLRYEHEWPSRLGLDTWLQYENCEAAGGLPYWRINSDGTTSLVQYFHNMEWCIQLKWSPGAKFYKNQSGKDNLMHLAKNTFVLKLTHTTGLLDGKLQYNRTEFTVDKRIGLSAFGYIDATARAGIVWDAVPFPKLFVPQSSQSLVLNPNTFCLMKPMEFIMDKYVFLGATYYLKGWLFNLIPYWNRLKLREVVSFNGVYGGLSAKNVPTQDTPGLYMLPDGCSPIGKVPYMEMTVGIENILGFLRIDYVRRLSYAQNLSGWEKNGIRFSLNFTF